MAMKIELFCYGPSDGFTEYHVIIDGQCFETFVTSDADIVDDWIRETVNCNRHRFHRLIVGLDTEWRPNTTAGKQNPVAILQLCVSKRCLIYQLHKADEIPKSLKQFLKNPYYTFVGVGIESDRQKLYRDYSLEVGKTVDLRDMATNELVDCDFDFKKVGLKKLAEMILHKDVGNEEMLKVRTSDWQADDLTNEQVMYACVDAYLCFEIGRQLQSWYD